MAYGTFELIPENESKDGHSYKVTVETGVQGMARLNVECLKPDSDEIFNSQGSDLTAAECRALAKMLESIAELLE